MPFSHTLAGTTFTDANFEGTAYANEQTGFPKALEKIVEHVANAYKSPSSTSLTVGTGGKSLSLDPEKPFAVGQPVRIASQSAPTTVFMDGAITAYDEETGAATVEVVSVKGGGTVASDWMVSVGGVTQNTVTASPLPLSDGGTGASDAAGARSNLGLGALATASVVSVAEGGTGATSVSEARDALGLGDVATDDVAPVVRGGTGATTASAARSNLGLGNDAAGRANLGLGAVATDDVVPVTRGGTGSTTQGGARTALGLGNLATINSPLPLGNGGTGSTTQAGARTNLGLGAVATDNTVPISRGGTGSTTASAARTALGLGSVATDNTVPISRGGTGSSSQAGARSNLGLGSIATVNSPVPIANGGTGATTQESARAALGITNGPKVPKMDSAFASTSGDRVLISSFQGVGAGWLHAWFVYYGSGNNGTPALKIAIDGGAPVTVAGPSSGYMPADSNGDRHSGWIPLNLRFESSVEVWLADESLASHLYQGLISWALDS